MPQIPTFAATPDAITDRMPMAEPGPFMAPGDAAAQAGAQLGSFGEEWEQRYVEAKRQQEGGALNAQSVQGLSDAAFRWSKVPDQQKALAGFTQEAQTLRQKILDQAPDPLVAGYVARNFDIEATLQATQTRKEAFGREASNYAGQLDQTLLSYANGAAAAPNDLARAHYTDLAAQAIEGAKAASWITGEEAAQRQIQFRSGVAKTQAEAMLRTDPSQLSDIMSDPTRRVALFPGLLPQEAEQLGYRADNRAYRMEMRANFMESRANARAERELHQTQGRNEGDILADIARGKPIDMGQVADMESNGQLAPGAFGMLTAAQDHHDAGRNDPMTLMHAQEAAIGGTLTPSQVHAGVAAGVLKPATGVDLVRAIGERQQRQQTAVERDNYNTLKTEFSGTAIETGIMPGTEEERAAQAHKWAGAQYAWTQRVVIGGEDSGSVLADIVSQNQQGRLFDAMPVAGRVTDAATLATAAVATVHMHEAGQLNDAQYQQQVGILNRLRTEIAIRGGTLPQPPGVLKPAPAKLPRPAGPGFGERLGNTFEDLAN